jgi:uncharacterized protein (DUF433 family)
MTHETVYTEGRITVAPDVCNGKPTIRGTRITVETVLDYLSAGDSAEDILKEYPALESEDIAASLAFASQLMKRRYRVVSHAS